MRAPNRSSAPYVRNSSRHLRAFACTSAFTLARSHTSVRIAESASLNQAISNRINVSMLEKSRTSANNVERDSRDERSLEGMNGRTPARSLTNVLDVQKCFVKRLTSANTRGYMMRSERSRIGAWNATMLMRIQVAFE